MYEAGVALYCALYTTYLQHQGRVADTDLRSCQAVSGLVLFTAHSSTACIDACAYLLLVYCSLP
jgi:hypothetical protein